MTVKAQILKVFQQEDVNFLLTNRIPRRLATQFSSLHGCFVRELKEGARPIERSRDVLVSPCDAIVGACGTIGGTTLFQAKGFPYTLEDLLCERGLVEI